MSKSISQACVLLGFTGLVACSAEGPGNSDEITASRSDPIINGTTVTNDTLGTPKIDTPVGYCSSTLLGDRWILTAHHCVTKEAVRSGGTAVDPASIKATMLNGATAKGTQVLLHPSVNVALVQLDQTFTNPSTGLPFGNPLFLGSATSLVNGGVYCQGWGASSSDGSGGGVLRSATLTVSSANSSSFSTKPNNFSQIQYAGDSGSPCFVTIDGVPRVVGVDSTRNTNGNQVTQTNQVSIDAFRDWAEGLMGNAATVFAAANFAGKAQAMFPSPAGGFYDYFRLLVGNDVISSLTVPTGWQVLLYNASGFKQFMQTFTQTTTYVGDSVNDRTSSVVVEGGVVVFQDSNLQSPLTNFTGADSLTMPRGCDNAVRSMSVPAGWRVQLFDNTDHTGASQTFEEGAYRNLDATASAISIEQPAEVYVNANFNGAVGRLLPGCYGWNALGVPNDSISSIFVPINMSVTVYTDGQYTGTSATFTDSQLTLSSTLNDKISSICVSRT